MGILAAAILGIIQGLTEFLPISSSAHLLVIPWLAGWESGGLTFDVALHLGTACAILTYFWKDWIDIAREWIRGIVERKPFDNLQRRMAWFLIVGSLPGAFFGFVFGEIIETHFRLPLISVFTLSVFGLLLFFSDKKGSKARTLEDFNWWDCVWVGLGQSLALIPGVSRSGITISVAMLRDLNRTSAARYSFLLSTPIILGAGILRGWQLVEATSIPEAMAMSSSPQISWSVLAVGVGCAAISGFLCIRYFLHYLRSHNFTPFVIYRMLLAAIVLLAYFRS